jgi:hypothetical protein
VPFNGSGVFSILNTFIPNTTILSSAVNANFTDIASGLSDCLTRDGQAGMTAAFKAISGALATPSITFTSDTTAGLYLSSAGVVGLVAKSLGLLVNSSVYTVTAAAVQAGGSGYAVGDTITLTGGTAITQAVLTVATLSGSAVATATVTYTGFYTVKPTDPVSQGSTSGAGTGATFNLTWAAQFASSVVTNESGALPWTRLGSSSFVSGLMAKANGFDFATAIGAANLAAVLGGSFLPTPQGRLTLTSGSPVMNSDVTAGSSIYYTPYIGNIVPITTNGTTFAARTFSELTLTLNVNHLTNTLYDIFLFDNAGTVTIGTGPAWSSATAGSSSRGAGAGTTELQRLNGLWTNKVSMTARNGGTTYTVAANRGTYVGTFLTTSAGTTACVFAPAAAGGGSDNKLFVWNTFNRVNYSSVSKESTASWSYTLATLRPLDNSTSNRVSYVDGLGESVVRGAMAVRISTAAVNGAFAKAGVGRNKTTGSFDFDAIVIAPTAGGQNAAICPSGIWTPSLGNNYIQAIEAGDGTNASTFVGGGPECYVYISLEM